MAPSAIDRYLRETRYEYVDKDGNEWVFFADLTPTSAGQVISSRLTPILERLLDRIQMLVIQRLDKENVLRRLHSTYQLRFPKLNHYDEAARLATKELLKFINEDLLDNIGGGQRGETKEPNEPSKSTDP